ncbi:hypothetical protein N7540_010233 [Penicillium herquei]|nr:hypothetical protein N7540_010233 [Penicillium herquei]
MSGPIQMSETEAFETAFTMCDKYGLDIIRMRAKGINNPFQDFGFYDTYRETVPMVTHIGFDFI